MELLRNRFCFLIFNAFLSRLMAHPMVMLEEEALGNIRLYTKAGKRVDFDYDLANTRIPSYGTEPLTDEVDGRAFRATVKRNTMEDISSTTDYPIRFFEDDHTVICRFSALALLSLTILFIMCFKLYKIKSGEQHNFNHVQYEDKSLELKAPSPFVGALTEDEETIFELKDILKQKSFGIESGD